MSGTFNTDWMPHRRRERMRGMETQVTYPPYSGIEARCPKCADSMSERYNPAGTVFVSLAENGCVVRYGKGPEWLFRECVNCGFGWPELCRDACGVAVGDVLGALPPEPPVGTVLAGDVLGDGEWKPVIDRRSDGWHVYDWEGGDPQNWRTTFDRMRPLMVVRVPDAEISEVDQ